MAQKGNAAELGTENIRKLLVQYAVPAIIAMTASSLYNMVTVFLSVTELVLWLFPVWPLPFRS